MTEVVIRCAGQSLRLLLKFSWSYLVNVVKSLERLCRGVTQEEGPETTLLAKRDNTSLAC